MGKFLEHTRQLLVDITACPSVYECLGSGDDSHPCYRVVNAQNVTNLERFHLPEPWNGDIESAQVLFISSNPSVDAEEEYPVGGWSESDVVDFFTNRFGDGIREWTRDLRPLLASGVHRNEWTRFWAGIQARAREICPDLQLGRDIAITEVVHCKSTNEIGVTEDTVAECASRWLDRILAVSAANVIVVLGAPAQAAISNFLGFTWGHNTRLHEVVGRSGSLRHYVRMPHTNAREPRTFKTVQDPSVTPDEMKRLKTAVNRQRQS